jgi:DNA-binding GntR family transcriptional regulator
MTTESERVYTTIIELIRDKRFVAGQPLREASIATELNVSRTPVREALRRLASEGTVELSPNKGATLVEFTDEDVADIWSLRAILEPFGARLAAERGSEQNVARLEELLAAMETTLEAGDLDQLTDLNNAFHTEIVEAAGSKVLRDGLALVRKKTLVRRTFGHYTPEQLQRSQQHHRDLIDAIRAGHGTWAESTMRAHIEAGQEVS